MAPGAVTHEPDEFAVTIFAAVVIMNFGRVFFLLRDKSGTVAPGAISPFRQNSLMTPQTNVAELAS